MFERYAEQARRSIFFAHFEANELGSPEIDTEHLLLGLPREVDLLKKTLSWAAAEQIRQEIKGAKPPGAEKISRSVDMPLTDGAKRSASPLKRRLNCTTHRSKAGTSYSACCVSTNAGPRKF